MSTISCEHLCSSAGQRCLQAPEDFNCNMLGIHSDFDNTGQLTHISSSSLTPVTMSAPDALLEIILLTINDEALPFNDSI